MKNNKICLTIPSLNVGGMERVTVELAKYIKNNTSYDVTIIKLAKSENNFYEVPKGVNLIEPDFIFNSRFRILHSFKLLFFLIKTIRKINPATVLSFGEMYNSFVLMSSFFSDAKYFVSDRSQPNKKWGLFHETMRKIIYKRAYGIIAQTNFSKLFFEKELNHNNIKVIPNPGRNNVYKPIKKDKIVLFVGRLISSKRVDILIDAFSKINDKEWQLWIVGDGVERDNLEYLREKSKLKNNIVFHGAQKKVEQYYTKAEIFAFPSISEGFPNVMIEALEFGLPLVAFDCISGPSDIIIENENGYLIPLMDEIHFREKLSTLMTNDLVRKSMQTKALDSSKKYNVEEVASNFLEFITS